MARAVAAALRFTGAIAFDAGRADGQLRKTACNGELRASGLVEAALGAKGFTPLQEGLNATAEWFTANYPHVRM